MTDRVSKSAGSRRSRDNNEPSLYEKLQENKAAAQTEFYEESKSELSGRNLTDEDAKFLSNVEEAKLQQELAIKKQTDAALHEFRIKHELLSREAQIRQSGYSKPEPIQTSLAKITDKIKSSTQQALPAESSIKSKRNMLGITPKSAK